MLVAVQPKVCAMGNGQSLRWGRILLGGFLIELVLILLVIPLQAFGGSEDAVTVLAVGGSFLAAVAIAAWLCRTVGRPLLHGVLMGACGAAITWRCKSLDRCLHPRHPPRFQPSITSPMC
jgi:hypothetical protein